VTDVDPTDSVRSLLEGAPSPLSTAEIAERLKELHGEHEIAQALDFWRREHHDVVQDDDGRWYWQGPRDS
jgi:hypothetical protein